MLMRKQNNKQQTTLGGQTGHNETKAKQLKGLRKLYFADRLCTPKDQSKTLLADIREHKTHKESENSQLPKEPITPRIQAMRRISQDSTLEMKNLNQAKQLINEVRCRSFSISDLRSNPQTLNEQVQMPNDSDIKDLQ